MSLDLERFSTAAICILGFGREGQSALRYIQQVVPRARLAVADRNALEGLPAGVRAHTGADYLEASLEYDLIIRSPGIPPSQLRQVAKERALPTISSATNLFFDAAPGTLIAVTGTKGKSTTSALLSHLLAVRYPDVRLVGNIGSPSLDALAGATADTYFVVECSSFQLEEFGYAPDVAIVLNIVEEHLDHHGDFAAYRAAKMNLVRQQLSRHTLVVNRQWESLAPLIAASAAQKAFFGSPDEPVFAEAGWIFIKEAETPAQPLIELSALPIRGPGNVQNALAAIRAAICLGLELDDIRRGLPSFRGLPHRLQEIATVNGVRFVDDSLSTIPQACINALEALGPEVHTLIAGGHDRGLDLSVLGEYLVASQVRSLISLPVTGEKIWQAYAAAGGQGMSLHPVASMQEAVALAFQLTPSGHICLLSPAASSLNLFRDYRDRGEQFAACILAEQARRQETAE